MADPDLSEFNDALTLSELRKANATLARQLGASKIKTAELTAAVKEAVTIAISTLEIPPVTPPVHDKRRRDGEVAVAVLSDWQLAKKTPTYSSEVCEQRIELYADKVIELTEIQRADHPVRELRVYLLGDIVEGELIFPGQAHLTDASLYQQVCVDGPRILANFVRRMLSYFEKVHVVGVIGNHGCASEDTEALTPSGWKPWSKVNPGEPIRVYNAETDEVSWEVPSEWTSYYYEGDMVHLTSTRVDQLVTPNHDFWMSTKRGPWRRERATDAGQYSRTVHRVGGHQTSVTAPPIVVPDSVDSLGRVSRGMQITPSADWAEWLGWYVSEGGVDKKGNRISLSQCPTTHPGQTAHIKVLCERVGLSWTQNQKNIRINNTPLARFLVREFGRTSHEKRLPSWLKAWPQHLIEAFLAGLRSGDGTASGVYSWTLTTTSDQLIDDVQEVCSSIGWGSSAKERYYSDFGKYLGSARKLHIHMLPVASCPPPMVQSYSGMVGCPTVSTGLWLTRRNGKVSVTGNSLGGRARRDYHPESNADAMLMEITRQLLASESRLTWAPNSTSGERHWYATDTIGDHTFFMAHGDQVRGGFAGLPWYGFYKKILGWRTSGIIPEFDYALTAHYHTPVRMYLNGVTLWGNGSTESYNTYALENLAASGEPCQWLLFCSPRRGVSAEYLVHLDKR